MPGTHRAVEVKLPEADALAQLYSINSDLGIAAHLCEVASGMALSPSHDLLTVEGLVTAALIRYF